MEPSQTHYPGHYRKAIRKCTPYLRENYTIPSHVDALVIHMFSNGHITDCQFQHISKEDHTQDKVQLLLEYLEGNPANIAQAFRDLEKQLSEDERRHDIPQTLLETLREVYEVHSDWVFSETLRKCAAFLVEEITIESKINDIVLHMVSMEHITPNEAQYISESRKVNDKMNQLIGYLRDPERDDKEEAFKHLVEKLSEDKMMLYIPKKLEETLVEVRKMEPQHEEHVGELLKRLDILQVPGPKCEDSGVQEKAIGAMEMETEVNPSDYETFQKLLNESDNLNEVNVSNENNQTLMMMACAHAKPEFVQTLLDNDNIDVNAVDAYGRSAFLYTLLRGDTEIISKLLNSGKVYINQRDRHGLTYVYYTLGINFVQDLASTVRKEGYGNMQNIFTCIKEKHTNINWEKTHEIISLLMQSDKVNSAELLNVMVVVGNAPLVSFILQSDINMNTEDVQNIILNGISGNDADILQLIVDSPIINVESLAIEYVDKILKSAIQQNNTRVCALILKLTCNVSANTSLTIVNGILAMPEDVLPEVFKRYDAATFKTRDSDGNSVYMLLCAYGSHKVVSEMLKYLGVDNTTQNNKLQTAFMLSMKNTIKTVPRLLLHHPSNLLDVNQKDVNGANSLFLACHAGNEKAVEILLKRPEIDVNEQDATGRTALQVLCMDTYCDETVRERMVSMFLEREDTDVNVVDEWGRTVLMDTCEMGKVKLVEMLLKRSEIDVNKQNSRGQTAVHIVCTSRSDKAATERIASLLLQRKEIDTTIVDGNGNNMLMAACCGGNEKVVEMLLNRPAIDVNKQNMEGQTALHILCEWGNGHAGERIVSLLLQREEIDITIVDGQGNNMLMAACRGGNDKVAEMLLKRPDIDVNKQNSRGQTSLHMVCGVHRSYMFNVDKTAKERIASLLLQREDIDTTIVDGEGNNMLMAACRGGNEKVVEMLLNRPAIDVNKQNMGGKTALHIVCSSQNGWLMRDETARERIVSLLLHREDIDTTMVDGDGNTMLMAACRGGNDKVAEMLLKRPEIDVNKHNGCGHSALIIACRYSCPEIVSMLLQKPELDVNLRDSDGCTSLMWSCLLDNETVVSALLGCDRIDLSATDKNSRTALDHAKAMGRSRIVSMIEARMMAKMAVAGGAGGSAEGHIKKGKRR